MILISFNTPPAFLHHHVGEPPLVFFAGNTLPAPPLSDSLPREKEREREILSSKFQSLLFYACARNEN